MTADAHGLQGDDDGAVLTLTEGVAPATFVNVWTTADRDEQRQLVEAMTAETGGLIAKPGFISMAFLRSVDGLQVVVLAQWASQEAFDAAITHDESAMAGRRRLQAHGRSSAHMHDIAAIYRPARAPE